MTLPYTPTPVKLPATIQLPQDVIDDVVVGTVNPPFQSLADALAYQILRVNGSYIQVDVTPGTYAAGTALPIVANKTGYGFSIVAGTRIRVTEAGTYLVTFTIYGGQNTAPDVPYALSLYNAGPAQPVLRSFSVQSAVVDVTQQKWSATGIVISGNNDEFHLIAPSTDVQVNTLGGVTNAQLITFTRLN
jgi:hypothetical protein